MTSTLDAPTRRMPDLAQASDVAPLFDTMRAIVEHRNQHRPVPAPLLDALRERRLGTLVEAIERYNARMGAVAISA